MIKKLVSALVLLIATNTFSSAQVDKMTIEWGDDIAAKRRVVRDLFYTGNPNEFYALNKSIRAVKGSAFLQRYEDLDLEQEVELVQDYGRGKSFQQDIIEINSNLYALTFRRDKVSESLTAQGVDREDLTLSGSEEVLYNVKLSKGIGKVQASYYSNISRDESKMVYVIEHPGDKDANAVTTVKLFNSNLELLWKHNISLESTKELSDIYSVSLNDNGTVYILSRTRKAKAESTKGERNYEFFITVVDEEGEKSYSKLDLGDYFVSSLSLNIALNGNLVCGGLYSEQGKQGQGVFYTTLSSDSFNILTQSFNEFDEEFLLDGYNEKQKKKLKKRQARGKELGLPKLSFRNIIVKEDGGAVMIGEYIRIYTTTYTDANGVTRSTTHYEYDDIYVVNIDSEGEIIWSERIAKTQHTTNDGGFYSSFFLFVGEEHLNFFFNIYEKKNWILHAVSLDGSGNQISKDFVSHHRKEKLKIRPKSCEQISDSSFILFALGKKKNRFAKVTIK
jgi:hypothetical protein